MSKNERKSMFLNTNVRSKWAELLKGTEISVDDESYEWFLADWFLVSSKALAENNPVAVATELDKANVEIKQLKAQVEELTNDLTDATEELKAKDDEIDALKKKAPK